MQARHVARFNSNAGMIDGPGPSAQPHMHLAYTASRACTDAGARHGFDPFATVAFRGPLLPSVSLLIKFNH